jgi:hypothetical protein
MPKRHKWYHVYVRADAAGRAVFGYCPCGLMPEGAQYACRYRNPRHARAVAVYLRNQITRDGIRFDHGETEFPSTVAAWWSR